MNWNFKTIMECIKSSVICILNNARTEYATGEEAMTSLDGKYIVENIEAEDSKVIVYLKVDTTIPNDQNADWVKDHIAMYGKEPELF